MSTRKSCSARASAANDITVVTFVDEMDVRRAVTKRHKIYVGPKTIHHSFGARCRRRRRCDGGNAPGSRRGRGAKSGGE